MTALLDTVEHETGPQPQWSVVWLHGLGADGNDFAPIVPELVRREWPAIRFVFPHAPVRAVTINGGARMRAWYDIRPTTGPEREDALTMRASLQAIHALMDAEVARGVPADGIVLMGFSQGCAMTLLAGLRYPHTLAGLVGWALAAVKPVARHRASTARVLQSNGKKRRPLKITGYPPWAMQVACIRVAV